MAAIDVLQKLWSDGERRLSGVKFTHDDGSTHLRLLLHGADVPDAASVTTLAARLAKALTDADASLPQITSRELWVYVSANPLLVERLELTAAELGPLRVTKVTYVDEATGHPLKVNDGAPHAAKPVRYDALVDGPNVISSPGGVVLPEKRKRLLIKELTADQKTVVDAAMELHSDNVRLAVVIDDEGPALWLVLVAKNAAKAVTLRVKLKPLALEVKRGLSPQALRNQLSL